MMMFEISIFSCRHHLHRVQSLPLYEIFYFESSSEVKQHLIAAPRLAIQTALSDPFKYLKVKQSSFSMKTLTIQRNLVNDILMKVKFNVDQNIVEY